MTTVAVITPWLGHHELAGDYWAAVSDRMPDEVIVVDNGDAPLIVGARVVRGYAEVTSLGDRDRRYLDDPVNLGFAGGCNLGLQEATSDVVVFLNNDVRVSRSGWLTRLLDAVETGVLAGPVLRSDAHADVDGQPMPYLDGWCIAGMRDDLLDLGGFSTDLVEPAYWSDNLLCLEARAAGFTLREVRGMGLKHLVNGTSRDNQGLMSAASQANHRLYMQRARELVGVAA